MNKLCEAFNRINKKFGANRVELLAVSDDGEILWFKIVGYGTFGLSSFAGSACVGPYFQSARDEQREAWLTAIANGGVRDAQGTIVDPHVRKTPISPAQAPRHGKIGS